MAQSFLQAVNRVLRIGGVLRGDTDPIQSFSDVQHGCTLNLAVIAIQSTLTDLTTFYSFPQERSSSSITMVTGQRLYSLASDFVGFWMDNQFFYDATQNNEIFEYSGGERRLAKDIPDYKSVATQSGYPSFWYNSEGMTQQIGLYAIPTADYNGRVWTYDYERDVIPLVEADNMPFIRDIHTFTFCDLAAIKFNSLFTQLPNTPSADVTRDPSYINARATLLRMITPEKPNTSYGKRYR
jgi:hypothetical protein